MDSSDNSQPTQATQNVVDPRRLGQQNSGFSDEDISDIICLLVPYSECAREEVTRIAGESSKHMLGRDDTGRLDIDFDLEDDVRNFGLVQQDTGEHHIALRFSAKVKNPVQGFTFGRNPNRCDICFENDPFRRLSNIHFRIYFNEWAVLMLEDMSTNGTIVDDTLLKSKTGHGSKRTLNSGSKIKILLHQGGNDLVFLVRIPLLQGEHQAAYERNRDRYIMNQALLTADPNETLVPGPNGHVDLFRPVVRAAARQPEVRPPQRETQPHNPPRMDGILRQWPGSDKYNRVGEVGRGAFATVYMVTSKFNGSPYAAKELDKRKFMKNGVLDQKVENEMKIMQQIEHPNIVRYIEHLDWSDRLLIIIMEYIEGGDLGKLILEKGPLPESMVQTMARQLLEALGYLHRKGITHRDVKPDNILVKSLDPFVTKLTDFGLSKMVENEETFLRTFCGTLLYCAPEVYSEYNEYDEGGRRVPRNRHHRPPVGQRYGHAVDVWSLGGVLFYALTKKPPFPAKSGAGHSELLHQIMTKPLDIAPLLQAGVSPEGIDFLSRMLDRRPETRASVEDLLQYSWVGGPGSRMPSTSQSFDEIEDEELRVEASQLSLKENGPTRDENELIPASDDEIEDDEEVNDENRFSGYESEKENYTFGAGNPPQPQRLFGEVNVSAVGSLGVIPAERLNLPVSTNSLGTPEILGGVSEIRDSFEDSDLSTTPRPISRRSQPQGDAQDLNPSQSRSVNALNNLTFDAASQSLGGTESILEHLNMKSRAPSILLSRPNDLNSSKRKSSLNLSEESDEPPPVEGRQLKRIRSAGPSAVPGLLPVDPADYRTFAHVPPIARGHHQIDTPVHKSTFWIAGDRKTWHLRYPEMTQCQFDAFKQGAAARGEGFGPGKGPLWDLAMKYFAPTIDERNNNQPSPRDDDSTTIPSTLEAATADHNDIPDTQPREVRQPVPGPAGPVAPWDKVVGRVRSARNSAVPNVSILVTESMISWGRAGGNTRVYVPRTETKVPKYSFKILLWKEGFDPYKDFRPWNRPREFAEDRFFFYISTKATSGIWINGVHLPSYDCKNSSGPCQHWMRLHDGDRIVVWQTADSTEKTELVFSCDWGDSSIPRRPGSLPMLVGEEVASKLDEWVVRTEKKMVKQTEHDLKLEEDDRDITARAKNIAREKDRSRIFELARLEASRALSRRRNSPGREAGNSWAGGNLHGNRTVPNYRAASPTMSEMLRAARGG